MNCLIFDADRSTASIGGRSKIKDDLGFEPVSVTHGVGQIGALLDKITTENKVEIKHELFADTGGAEIRYQISENASSIGLAGIVIDSLSVAGNQTREQIMREHRAVNMDLQLWGKYGEKMIRFVQKLCKLEAPVVVTAHVDRGQDENGGPLEVPDLKGSAKTSAARYFDIVAYSIVSRNRKGEASYSWQIVSDNRRTQAKSRLPYPSETGIIDQDFGPLIAHYRENDIPNPKILIIGDSGAGKTTALKTLSKVN